MTQEHQLSREEQIVAFFVTKCGGKRPLGRTQLMKLLYLADYEARRYMGRPISELPYVWHHFGPYNDRLVTTVKALERREIIREERVTYPTGQEGYQYRPGVQELSYDFSSMEVAILRYVCNAYSDMKLQALLSVVVYETEPMQDVRARDARGEQLDMDMVNDDRRFEYGMPFEELYARIQRVRGGTFVAHDEVMRALREKPGAP